MKLSIRTLFICLLVSFSGSPALMASTVVVVNAANTADISEKNVRKIFLGKIKTFPNGVRVKTFNLPDGNKHRELFRKEVLRKSASSLNSYWARMLFSSKAAPPKTIKTSFELKSVVANNKQALAYIDEEDVDDSVRVLFKLSDG